MVLGMHRSGTSALARLLGLLGCDLPKSPLAANAYNERGYWESAKISELNDRILIDANSNWFDWTEFNPEWYQSYAAKKFHEEAVSLIEQEFGDSGLFVLKDPRICRFFPFWSSVLESINISPLALIPLRNPLEVANSLQERDGIDLSHGQLIWLRNVLDVEAYTQHIPRAFCSYDELLASWWELTQKLSDSLEINWPNKPEDINSSVNDFLSLNLKHHNLSEDSILDNPFYPDWYKTVFSIMNQWITNDESAEDRETLGKIRYELNASSPLFSGLVSSSYDRKLSLENVQKDLKQKNTHLESQLEQKEARLENLERSLTLLRSQSEAKDLRIRSLESKAIDTENKLSISEELFDAKNEEFDVLVETLIEQFSSTEELSKLRKTLAHILGSCSLGSITLSPVRLLKLESYLKSMGLFSSADYKNKYPDIRDAGCNAFAHYVRYGLLEGRKNFSTTKQSYTPTTISHETKERIQNSMYFDADWYLEEYPDVKASGLEPLEHYVNIGWRLKRNPSRFFNSKIYLKNYKDVATSGVDPLLHFIQYGQNEKRTAGTTPPEAWWDCEEVPKVHAKSLIDLFKYRSPVPVKEIDIQLRTEALEILANCDKKVSVIIPTWNRKILISRALDSIFAQSFMPHEIIISDDGSEDGTVDFIKEAYATHIDKKLLKIIENPHKGVSFARNSGMEHATGDWFAYLDSDNIWDRDHLLWVMTFLEKNPLIGSCYTALLHRDLDTNIKQYLAQPFDWHELLRSNFIDLNSYVHNRSLFDEYDGFDEELTRLVDWELVIRYSQIFEPKLVPIVTVDYESTNTRSSVTRDIPLSKNIELIRNKHEQLFKKKGLITANSPAQENSQKPLALKLASIEKPVTQARLVVILNKEQLSSIKENDLFQQFDLLDIKVDIVSEKKLNQDNNEKYSSCYWYPDLTEELPSADELRQLILSVLWSGVDIAILSCNLDATDSVGVFYIQNQTLVSQKSLDNLLNNSLRLMPGLIAKVVRSPCRNYSKTNNTNLSKIFKTEEYSLSSDGFFHIQQEDQTIRSSLEPLPALDFIKKKPVVLVIPMKLAVGGVERNTIEVMRKLDEEFDFIYLTMEEITSRQGSVAHQVVEVTKRLLDMAQASTHADYLKWLEGIKREFQPDLIWICNGSMWLCANAVPFRSIFSDTPIFDQQVYDTEEGWINRYHEPGIQSFDHFVAINSKIQKKFTETLCIPEDKISLIYSVIDSEKFRRFKSSNYSINELRTSFGLPLEKKVFAFMGRLTDQKRPMDFLKLALKRKNVNDEFYVFVGDGVLANECEGFFQKEKPKNILWIRNVADTVPFWACVDGLIVTSFYEGLPIVVLESLSMGKPVIATDCGDIRIVLDQHQGGAIFSENSLDVMYQDLQKWSEHNMKYKTHLKAESENILGLFSSERISEQYSTCWKKLIKYNEQSIKSGGGVE